MTFLRKGRFHIPDGYVDEQVTYQPLVQPSEELRNLPNVSDAQLWSFINERYYQSYLNLFFSM